MLDDMEIWDLCGEMTVVQATLFCSGVNPTWAQDVVESQIDLDRPKGYDALKSLILGGLRSGEITGRPVPHQDDATDGLGLLDPKRSIVEMDSLRRFMGERGIEMSSRCGNKVSLPPKLLAACKAFMATESLPLKGKTRKQLITQWLTEHAAEHGLVDKKGNRIESAIEEIARIANPDPLGGAPRTP
jgi:hypothetical protein